MEARLNSFSMEKKWPDAELRIHWPAASSAEDSTAASSSRDDSATELLLPVHRIILANSEYFEAQLLRWSDKRHRSPPIIQVAISSKQHLTGLLAALAVLYHEEQLLREVSQQDLVAAAVYGDQLAIPRAVELGLQLLKEEAKGKGCTLECCKALAALPAWPACLLPLVPLVAAQNSKHSAAQQEQEQQQQQQQQQVYQAVLVAAPGDLETVWEDRQLHEHLLALPLPAVQLLLSSDQLRVASEDTVLYTALRYVEQLDSIQRRQVAMAALSKCIRCVRLSRHNLLAHGISSNSIMFSGEQQQLLLQMLSLCLVSPEHCIAEFLDAGGFFKVPAAWLSPQRAYLVPVSPKVMTWRVAAADIKASYRSAASGASTASLSSDTITPPMSGLAFGLKLQCRAEGTPPSVWMGVYVAAQHVAPPCLNLKFTITAVGIGTSRTMYSLMGQTWGWGDFLGVGSMGGDGWDEAAWAAAGLPVEGHLELQLTVEPL